LILDLIVEFSSSAAGIVITGKEIIFSFLDAYADIKSKARDVHWSLAKRGSASFAWEDGNVGAGMRIVTEFQDSPNPGIATIHSMYNPRLGDW
jgi:hypothetical protein